MLRICWLIATLVVLAVAVPTAGRTDSIHVAVASNFSEPAKELVARFEQANGHQVVLVAGSTGKHYAQIKHGAPFAAFLAADRERPELLEREGVGIAGSVFIYAVGRLALWSPATDVVAAGGEVLRTGRFEHLAIANPRLAPYGAAAQQVLTQMGLWDALQPRLVMGENIAQTYHFVQSGNAELGLVALSQIKRPNAVVAGSVWEIPATMHEPIAQAAVLLDDNPVARAFLEFLRSDEAKALIRGYGYDVP